MHTHPPSAHVCTPITHAGLLTQYWDGKPRLNRWLPKALGLDATASKKERRYLELVGRYIVMAHVARLLEPGCKFDHAVLLRGPQGMGKSTLVQALVGAGHYSDVPAEFKNGSMRHLPPSECILAYELTELSMFSRAEIEGVKAFLSCCTDRFRAPDSTWIVVKPRQFVVWCSSGECDYLSDATNRRFWVVDVAKPVNTAWLHKHRAQLFAEAHHRFRQGKRFTPSARQEERYFVPAALRASKKGGAA